MTWRLHIEKIAAKALGTYIGTYSIFKSKLLIANIKLIVYRALIRSIMTWPALPLLEVCGGRSFDETAALAEQSSARYWQP
jgi:hypothetical protein